jgi:hypothetical protein
VELAAEARDAEQRNSHVALLRQLLRIVETTQMESGTQSAMLFNAGRLDPATWDSEWKCAQQHDLAAALKGVASDTDLPMCRILAVSRGVDKVSSAALEAFVPSVSARGTDDEICQLVR